MQFRKKQLALAVSVALASISAAHAADAPQLDAIEVVGHYDNAVGTSDAASQGTVNASLIQNRPAMRTGEMLEFVPGMIVTQHSGDGKANQYFLRGFNLDHGTDFATFVDGIPVNMRTHAHGQGYTDLNFIMPELVERIDYKKGPYFADEGDFASAGAAHFRLADTLQQGIASVTVGSHDYVRTVIADSLAMGDGGKSGNLLYGLEVTRNNGPWDVAEDVRKYSGTLRYSGGNKNDGYSITAMAYKNTWNSTDQVPDRAISSGLIDRFGAIDQTDAGDTSRYSLNYAMHKRSQDSLFEMNVYAVQSRLSLYNNFTYFLNDPVNGDQNNQREDRKMAGFNIAQTWMTRVGGIDMQNKIGIQTRYDKLSPVGLYNTVDQVRLSTVREDDVKEASFGVFAENTSQWTEKFRTVTGLRYDQYHVDVDSSNPANSGKKRDDTVSPKLSLIFGPWEKTEYFINYGKGFHSNDARGTTQTQLPSGDPATSSPLLVSTRGAEVGLRTEIVPGLQSSLSLWRLDSDSELVFVGDAGETEPSRASRRTGVEWNNHYIATPWLLFDMDLAVSRARYRDDDPVGNDIPGSINRVASFGATVTDLGRWSGALQLRYFGPRPLIEDDSVRSKATTLAYARVGYKIDQKTRLSLDIFNLFNKKASDIDYYYTSRLQGEPAEGVDDIHSHPVESRAFRLTLTHNF
jgi:outer membrane receptor protein involved in Fe transport